jgi:transcriptional regulator with XRE-family HTH domain
MVASRNKPHPLREIVGMCVRLERTRNNLSQEELGQAIGRDQAYISQIESAARSLTVDVLGRISEVLGVRPAELMDENFGRRVAPPTIQR